MIREIIGYERADANYVGSAYTVYRLLACRVGNIRHTPDTCVVDYVAGYICVD